MAQDSFLWGLEITDSLTMELTSQMTVIALGVAVICFICNFTYNYLYHGVSQLLTSDENKFPDLMEIARCFALIFCLSLYIPIVKTVVGTLDVINEATSLTDNRNSEFAAYLERSASEQGDMIVDYQETSLKAGIDAGEDTDGAMQKEIDNMKQDNEVSESASLIEKLTQFLNPGNWVAMALHAFAAILIGIIQAIILGIGVVIIKILVILGPFAFAFSILPVFQKQLSIWFGTLFSTGFVFTVINVLNQIMWFTFKSIFDAGDIDQVDQATKQIQYLGLDISMIGAYCCCFWLASRIVGHGDAGKIISKTVAILTTAATMVVGGAAMAKGAANVGAAASVGKSIINDQD